MSQPVLLSIDGSCATITMNTPDRRNALGLDAWRELALTTAQLDADDTLRCVVVRGAGRAAFAAGADIKEFETERANATDAIVYGDIVAKALNALVTLKHPTIAMIYGACTGGGLEIACACDMRISSETGRFGVPINRIGHAFAFAEAEVVMNVVPRHIVLELVYEGRLLNAEQAFSRGLLNRVVADDQLETNVAETVARITAGAPLAARMSKKITRRLLDAQPVSRQELEQGYEPCDSADYQEGVNAFLNKRAPTFTGQ